MYSRRFKNAFWVELKLEDVVRKKLSVPRIKTTTYKSPKGCVVEVINMAICLSPGEIISYNLWSGICHNPTVKKRRL
jgi:hypothetical protein